MRKKLQIFISSTYSDQIEERQSAVQAILSCGHIPTGMELFTASNKTQMSIIKKWIDESDVYLLILGGRYASIKDKSQKNYTHLEYDYAIKQNKPFFALVKNSETLEKKIKRIWTKATERDNHPKLKKIKNDVSTRMVKFYDDFKDIKLAVHETLPDFERGDVLNGWNKVNKEIDTVNINEELARLTKENSLLRKQISKSAKPSKLKNIGLTCCELEKILKRKKIKPLDATDSQKKVLQKIKDKTGDEELNLLHYFILKGSDLVSGNIYHTVKKFDVYLSVLKGYGIIINTSSDNKMGLSDDGRKFYLKCILKY